MDKNNIESRIRGNMNLLKYDSAMRGRGFDVIAPLHVIFGYKIVIWSRSAIIEIWPYINKLSEQIRLI